VKLTDQEKINYLRDIIMNLMDALKTASPLADQTYAYRHAQDALHDTRPE
jgi:hypothetical protein